MFRIWFRVIDRIGQAGRFRVCRQRKIVAHCRHPFQTADIRETTRLAAPGVPETALWSFETSCLRISDTRLAPKAGRMCLRSKIS
jgi:hypothetical protein